MSEETPPIPAQRSKGAHEVWISALAYPGAGQWLQGRRFMAWLFIVPTTVLFLWIVGILFWPLIVNICALFEIGGKTSADAMGVREILALLSEPRSVTLYVALAVVYLWNVIDAAWAHKRRSQT